MAIRQQRIKVPTFTKAILDLADLCARDLWRGIDYETGKKQVVVRKISNKSSVSATAVEMSEEELLKTFATPFYKKVSNPKSTLSIPTTSIQEFINIAKLQVVNTRKSNLDYQKGIAVINDEIAKRYKGWNLENTEKDFSAICDELIKKLSDGLFTSSTKQETGTHLALASRILFFTIPDMPIFNLSTPITKGMKLGGEQNEMLVQYTSAMQDGLERNWQLLCNYQMPYPTTLDSEIWQKARDSGWWQRRVLDLALKFYFAKDSKGKRELKVNDFIIELFMAEPHTH